MIIHQRKMINRFAKAMSLGIKSVFFILFFSGTSFSQIVPGQWTWMHGSNAPNSAGVFGTQGVSSPTNAPPALYEPCEWTDLNGNFWLFGGAIAAGSSWYGDLWKYDPSTNQWTWMKGTGIINQLGVYGTQGVPSPANMPEARGHGTISWVDNAGDLWLFGGYGYNARFSDLWRYNIASNQWTWMKGPNINDQWGVYGTQGVSAPANNPGARAEVSTSWTDNSGNLWLYGGDGYDAIGTYGSFLNDVWKYTIATNEWTWMHGSNIADQPAVYGVQGVAAPGNTPGARQIYTKWKDNAGNLWLFGGKLQNLYLKNDLWKYDVSTNQWTWVKGPSTNDNPGSYGSKCVSSSSSNPPSRLEARTCWTDDCGNLWLFGGASIGGLTNDLWCYQPGTNRWIWVSGANTFNQTGLYGSITVSSAANRPGARMGSIGWKDNTGNLWLFGGATSANYHNDLWRYVIDPTCVPGGSVIAGINGTNTICSGQSTTLTGTGGGTYMWNTGATTAGINVSPGATATYTLIVTGPSACPGSDTAYVTVTVNNNIASISGNATTCPGDNTILTASGGGAYMWNTGVTTSSLSVSPTTTTTYSVIVSNGACSDTATHTITIGSGPIATISGNATICAGSSTTLIASGGGTYAWNTGTTTSALIITPTSNATYSVVVSTGTSCSDTATETVVVNSPPVAAIAGNTTICTGEISTLTATGGGTYAWNTGATTSSLTVNPTSSTTYSVIVSNGTGLCSDTATATLTVNSGPAIVTSTNATVMQGQSATLTASGGGAYNWAPSSGLSCTSCPNPIATPSVTTIYCVTVMDATNCTATECVTITVLTEPVDCSIAGEFYLPNAFSPNADGENDLLKIYYDPACVETFNLIIYDRWGESVYETNDPAFTWNGIYKDKLQNSAVFVYSMEVLLISGEQINKKGNISLIR